MKDITVLSDIFHNVERTTYKAPENSTLYNLWHDTFRDGKFDLDNTNKLVKRYRGTTVLKQVSPVRQASAFQPQRAGRHQIYFGNFRVGYK